MHRVLVALLAAFDAVITAAVGIVVVLAPLTLLWVVGAGAPEWSALWPATAAIWQLGHLVPLTVHLPVEYVAAAGIPEAAASFTLSLAPLALALITAVFAARSGVRAGRSGRAPVAITAGVVAFAAVAVVVALTGRFAPVGASVWQAVLLPTLVYAVPAAGGALVAAWSEGDAGGARLREHLYDLPGLWPDVPALVVRGAGIALTALVGLGGVAVVLALLVRGGQVVALYQAGNVDTIGVVVVSLAQLAYLPTLVVWGMAYLAGPGFALGADTAVSPAGTEVGVVPGIPVLGGLPESGSPWLLVLVLLPIGAGALAGWMLRTRVRALSPHPEYPLRVVLAAGIGVLSAAGAALLAWAASGAIGPGRLAHVGPHPGAIALAVGIEVLVGCAILLLGPDGAQQHDGHDGLRRTPDETDGPTRQPDGAAERWTRGRGEGPEGVTREPEEAPRAADRDEDQTDTAPIDPGFLGDRP